MEIQDALFDYNSAALGTDAQRALTKDSAFLMEHEAIKFTFQGHCDERGSEEYNLGLGDLRATAAKNFLLSLGIREDRSGRSRTGKTVPFVPTTANRAGRETGELTSYSAPIPSSRPPRHLSLEPAFSSAQCDG